MSQFAAGLDELGFARNPCCLKPAPPRDLTMVGKLDYRRNLPIKAWLFRFQSGWNDRFQPSNGLNPARASRDLRSCRGTLMVVSLNGVFG